MMKTDKSILCGVFVAVMCVFFVYPQMSEAGDSKTITVNKSNWPPYFFPGKSPDDPKGIAIDVLEMCLPETGYVHEFKLYPVKRMLAYLEEGKLDIHISGLKGNVSYLEYGKEPAFSTAYKPIVRIESTLQIHSPQDLDDYKLGHLAGVEVAFSEEFREYIQKREQEGMLVATPVEEALFNMLLAGRIDAFIFTEGSALWRAKTMGILDKIKILDFTIRTSDSFVVVSKNSNVITDQHAFLNTIDQCIKAAKTDGRYAEITRKYGIE